MTVTEFLEYLGRIAERRFKDDTMNLEHKLYYVVRDIVGIEYVVNPEKRISERQQK